MNTPDLDTGTDGLEQDFDRLLRLGQMVLAPEDAEEWLQDCLKALHQLPSPVLMGALVRKLAKTLANHPIATQQMALSSWEAMIWWRLLHRTDEWTL